MSTEASSSNAESAMDQMLESFIRDTEDDILMDQVWKADRRMAFLAGMSAGFTLVARGLVGSHQGGDLVDRFFEEAGKALGYEDGSEVPR
ncbi:MAG: hypothetical protein U0790_25155 [Isosphaeraceae bacterium]